MALLPVRRRLVDLRLGRSSAIDHAPRHVRREVEEQLAIEDGRVAVQLRRVRGIGVVSRAAVLEAAQTRQLVNLAASLSPEDRAEVDLIAAAGAAGQVGLVTELAQ